MKKKKISSLLVKVAYRKTKRSEVMLGEVIKHGLHLYTLSLWGCHSHSHGVIWDFYEACGCGQEVGVGARCVYVCVSVCSR